MAKQRVLVVLGSPRKNGNSAILAAKCADAVKEAGAEVESVFLQGLKIAPCNACDACIKNPKAGCVIKDDMIPLYKKIEQATAIVFVTPTYWFIIYRFNQTIIFIIEILFFSIFLNFQVLFFNRIKKDYYHISHVMESINMI